MNPLNKRRFTKGHKAASPRKDRPTLRTEVLEGRELLTSDLFALSTMLGALSRGGRGALPTTSLASSSTAPPAASAPVIPPSVVPQTFSQVSPIAIPLGNTSNMVGDEGPGIIAQADADDVIQFRLAVTNASGTPITSINVGDTFQLRGFVKSIGTAANTGVFAGFLDVTYNSALASTSGPIGHGTNYTNGTSGSLASGLIDEVGGINTSSTGSSQEFLLFQVPFTATAAGTLNFAGNSADSVPGSNSLLYDPPTAVAASNIEFGTVSLTIQAAGVQDLVQFAKDLRTSGAILYGAVWDAATTEQKDQFQDGGTELAFIDVTNPDRTDKPIVSELNITTRPTWIFGNGQRLTGVRSLAEIATASGIPIPSTDSPSFKTIGPKNLLGGSPLMVAVDGYDPNNGPLTYTVTSDNPSLVTPTLIPGANKSLRISTAGYGDMVFKLFEDLAPRATNHITQLANDDFYNGIIFHRVEKDFVIQGGDPNGTGSGGSTLGNFDDQFHVDLQHNQTGILSMAKSDDDTNDSQFFITTNGPERFLDFNHTIFGYQVEGQNVLDAIRNTPVGANNRPVNTVTMDDVSVFTDTENGVIMLKAAEGATGTTTITVQVTDQQGKTATETFTVTVTADTVNSPPFLTDFTPDVFSGPHSTPIVIPVDSIDVEGNAATFDAVLRDGPTGTTVTPNTANKTVTVTPPANFAGPMKILIGAFPSAGSQTFDSQEVTALFHGIDLWETSDSGVSNRDNITKETTLEIRVTGVPENSSVELLRDGVSAGTAVAGPNGAVFNYNASANTGSVVFTARVTTNGNTTDVNHQLTVTIDRELPAVSSTPPASVKKGQNLNYNVESSVETATATTYSLTENPTGATINAQTGVISWTPALTSTATSESFKVRVQDVAGNTISHDFTVTVLPADRLAEFTVQVLDLNGNPLTSIAVGSQFQVRVLADDIRDGVTLNNLLNVFVDMTYDSNLVSIPSGADLQLGPIFVDSPIKGGTNTQPGRIDEAGGSTALSLVRNNDPMLVFTQRFIANAVGTVTFATAQAVHPTTPGLHILVFVNPNATAANAAQALYQSVQVPIFDGILANNDTASVAEDATDTPINVLANDLPAGQGTITAAGTPSQGGTVTINQDRKGVTYRPAANFFGTETFTYTLSLGNATPSVGTVTVTVNGVNDPPTATDDSLGVAQGSSNQELNVLANDSFAPDANETLTISAVTQGTQGGSVTRSNDNLRVVYTPPNATFVGTDTFTYTISDGNGGTDTATVTVAVNIGPPGAPDLAAASDSGQSSTDNITNATNLNFTVGSVINGATVALRANGTPIGTPVVAAGASVNFAIDAASLSGDVVFTAVQTQNGNTSSASALLTVTIDRILPGEFTSTPGTTAFVGGEFTYDANVPDEASVRYSLINHPQTATIVDTTGVIRWTPAVGDLGTRTFSVQATDVAGNVRTQPISLTVTTALVAFTARLIDHNNNDQSVTSVGTGSELTVQVFIDDQRTSPATPGFTSAFAELVFPADLVEAIGTPTVNSVFGSPVTGTIAAGKVSATGGTVTAGTDSAEPTLLFSQRFRAKSALGSATFRTEFAEQTGRGVIFEGDANAVPEAGIAFGTSVLSIVQGISALADTKTVAEDAAATSIDVLTNDLLGPTSGELTITNVSPPNQNGTVTISQDKKTVLYTPRANFFGTETFTYTTTDRSQATSVGTVTVTVTPVNDPPTAVDDTANTRTNADPIQINVLANDSFAPDTGETLTISAVSTGSRGGTIERINNNTAIRYLPAAGVDGTETFTYTVSDGNGGTDNGTVTVTIAKFATTAVTGKIFLDTNRNGSQDTGERPVSGTEVKLDGTSNQGAAVHLTTRTNKNGEYSFPTVDPGNYTVTQGTNSLLSGGAVLSTNPSNGSGGIVITPGNAGGQSQSNNFGAGGIVPQFNMLYALASTPRNPVEFASNAQGQTQWQLLDDVWDDYQSLELTLSTDGRTVTILATETDGDRFTRSLSTRETALVQVLGEANGTRLVRLIGQPSAFALQAVPRSTTQGTTAAQTASGVSSSDPSVASPNRAAGRNAALDAIFANIS